MQSRISRKRVWVGLLFVLVGLLQTAVVAQADDVPAVPAYLTVTPDMCYGWNWAEWEPVEGATYYELYGSTSSSFPSQSLYYSGPDWYTDVYVGGMRYLRVRACNDSGCSGYRNGNRPAIYVNGCL
jgi:hypothetical protein